MMSTERMTISVILFLALAAFGTAAESAGARNPAAADVAVDPRFELLGVVQHLSGRAREDADTAGYRERVEKRFGSFRDHPAVALYRDLVRNSSREEATATILMYFSGPPELALKDRNADIHYLNGPGEAEEMHRFLHELRDFARASDFTAFFRDNRDYYDALEAAARKTLGPVDPVASLEAYLGLGLATSSYYILAPLNRANHAFISPYPLPPDNIGARSFEAYTLSPELFKPVFWNGYWLEPLYVFIDPSHYYFEKLNIPSPEDFYGPEIARCGRVSPNCVKEILVNAIVEHLNRKAGLPSMFVEGRWDYSKLITRRIKALSERLDEYDSRRDLYPTLWDFYPRWFSAFEEEAFPGRAPSRLAVPAAPKIRAAPDFFDPATAAALVRASAR